MEIFKIEQLNELLNVKGLHHVTIFSPTSRDSSENYQKDKINFKNQLQEAVSELNKMYGMSDSEAREYLQPGYDLLDNPEFWQHGSDGLAYFQSSKGVNIKTLPIEIEEPSTYVGKSFMLRPLMPLLNGDGRFYIINLNLKGITLFEATEATISEILLDDEEFNQISDYTKYIENQQHLGARLGHGGPGGSIHYGQGGGNDSEKVEIQQFFYKASKPIDDIINCDPLPAILTGVEYLIPMYKTASDYHKYAEESIHGSFTTENVAALHAKAWEIMAPKFEEERDERFGKYAELANGDWASSDTHKVIKAAFTGQVETLFVQEDAAIWGVFNEQLYELEIEPAATPETKDLLTEAAIKTIMQQGKVYQCTAEEMPEDGEVISAIFRNPVTM